MSSQCRSRRWFFNPFTLFDKVSDCCGRGCKPKKARLNLLKLEERITPSGTVSVAQWDAVGYIGKTVSVRLQHSGMDCRCTIAAPSGIARLRRGSDTIAGTRPISLRLD